jgi:hypothetical protein
MNVLFLSALLSFPGLGVACDDVKEVATSLLGAEHSSIEVAPQYANAKLFISSGEMPVAAKRRLLEEVLDAQLVTRDDKLTIRPADGSTQRAAEVQTRALLHAISSALKIHEARADLVNEHPLPYIARLQEEIDAFVQRNRPGATPILALDIVAIATADDRRVLLSQSRPNTTSLFSSVRFPSAQPLPPKADSALSLYRSILKEPSYLEARHLWNAHSRLRFESIQDPPETVVLSAHRDIGALGVGAWAYDQRGVLVDYARRQFDLPLPTQVSLDPQVWERVKVRKIALSKVSKGLLGDEQVLREDEVRDQVRNILRQGRLFESVAKDLFESVAAELDGKALAVRLDERWIRSLARYAREDMTIGALFDAMARETGLEIYERNDTLFIKPLLIADSAVYDSDTAALARYAERVLTQGETLPIYCEAVAAVGFRASTCTLRTVRRTLGGLGAKTLDVRLPFPPMAELLGLMEPRARLQPERPFVIGREHVGLVREALEAEPMASSAIGSTPWANDLRLVDRAATYSDEQLSRLPWQVTTEPSPFLALAGAGGVRTGGRSQREMASALRDTLAHLKSVEKVASLKVYRGTGSVVTVRVFLPTGTVLSTSFPAQVQWEPAAVEVSDIPGLLDQITAGDDGV